MQANDNNYLIPVQEVENDALLDYKALRVQHVLSRVESAGCHLNLVLLDACRSKPSAMRGGTRSLGRGLAKIEATAGSVIAFACAPGETASDGDGRNGVFTANLLQHLGRAGVDVDFMLGDVAQGVEEATKGGQKPFRNHNLQGARPCCLLTGDDAPGAVPAAAPAAAPPAVAPATAATAPSALAPFFARCSLVEDDVLTAAMQTLGITAEKDLALVTEADLALLKLPPVVMRKLRAGLANIRGGNLAKAHALQTATAASKADSEAGRVAVAKPTVVPPTATLSAKAQEYARMMEGVSKLDMQKMGISPADASALGEALKVNRSLTTLDLSSNSFGDAGASALGEALKVNRSLTMLTLYGNNIGDAGASALGEALKVNRSLTMLSLSSNSVGDAGASALGEALKVNRSLTTLGIFCNKSIGDAGASALGEALKVNRTLTTLDLAHNSIGDAGASALGEALKVNRTLATLNVFNNRFGDQGVNVLRDSARAGCSLVGYSLVGYSAPGSSSSSGGCCVIA